MKLCSAAFVALACLMTAQGAVAQGVPRIKAKVLSFDGKVLKVTSGTGAQAETLTVGILPTTRYVRQEDRALADIAAGNYIGATVTKLRDGTLRAVEIHIFPEELRGNNEGIFTAAGRTMIDGTVRTTSAGSVSVAYRGADGGDGAACTGHAPRVGGCQGSADIVVTPAVPVTALVPADKSLLVPGAIIALSVAAGPDGRPVTPGLTFVPGTGEPVAGPAPALPPAAKVRGH